VKVNLDLKNNKINNNNNVSFGGFQPKKDNEGALIYEFNYPYDPSRYDCYLEVCALAKDRNNNYYINEGLKCGSSPDGYYKLKPKNNLVDLTYHFGLMENEDFAYHYVLVPVGSDRNNHNAAPMYKIDAGDYIDSSRTKGPHEIYNIVTSNASRTTNGGSMKLLVPDSYNPLYIYDKDGNIVKNPDIVNIRKMNKTFSNKVGGTLAGIEKDVRDGKFDGYERIISTPIFTDDSLSSHGYWNKNCFQMVHSLGNINNYASLQREMFKKGINFVSDGAFVNEGLEGIHFKHVLKWGQQSPYFNWFKANNLKNGAFTLGVFPKNHEFVSHKLVNAPFITVQDPKSGKISTKSNKNYTNKKPTYIQIFDKRLVSDKHQKDTQYLIRKYDRQNTDNPLDINSHNDTLMPYAFEINPDTYLKNIKVLNEYNSKLKNNPIKLDSYMGTRFVSKFENFELEEKIEGKITNWDANTDIIKLNFLSSREDKEYLVLNFDSDEHRRKNKELERKNYEVQDYTVAAGKYWTEKTADILNLYIAQQLKAIDSQNPNYAYSRILDNIDSNKFPYKLKKEVCSEIIKNVFNGSYNLQGASSQREYKDELLAGLMKLPLDSIEFGDNLCTVLASPYITKRATSEETLGASRYEMYKLGNPHLLDEYANTYHQMDKIYKKELNDFASEIIDNLNAIFPEGSKIYEGYNSTVFGKYVLPQISEIITKFAIVKALAPDTEVKINPQNGELSYDYNALKSTSLETLGIYASSPEDEAKQVLNKIQSGIKNIKDADKKFLTQAIFQTLRGTNENSFKLAEMIVDRLNAGLDWRIDATKDIANMDSLKDSQKDGIDQTWTKLTNFWKEFADNIYSKNKNSYIVAEITDEDTIFKTCGKDSSSKYNSGNEMVKKFLRETGMTGTANYSYYFSSILNMFAKHFDENGRTNDDGFNDDISLRMRSKSLEFFEKTPLKSIIGSYNFIGNHDKPRTLHGLIVNTDWYTQDLNDKNNFYYREKAYRLMNGNFLDPTIPRLESDTNETYNDRLRLIINNTDFSNAGRITLAMVEALQKGFEKAISSKYPHSTKRDINESVNAAIYKSLGDIAKGNYLDKNFSADGFGVKPVETAVDIIINQAVSKHGLNLNPKELESLKNSTIKAILEPALTKLVAMTEVLSVMPGMPTLYAGDDLGATGYESSSKNIYLQNRGYIRREWADPKNTDFEFIKKHYDKMNEIMRKRSKPELNALNNGTPYLLPVQSGNANNRHIDLTAILRQDTDGSVVVSLINTAGINKDFTQEYKPIPVKLDRIDISNSSNTDSKTYSSGLAQGTILYNADNPKDTYMVKEYNGNYFIKHVELKPDGTIKKEDETIVNGTTLTLYTKPKKQVFNKRYNLGPRPYTPLPKEKLGEKLYYLAT